MADGIRRRGILGLLAALPAAGPAVAHNITGRHILGLGAAALKNASHPDDDDGDDNQDSDDVGEYYGKGSGKAHYRDYIKTLIKNQREFCNKPISYYMRQVDRLDADLQTNRSLSLHARIRAQAERNRIHAIEEKKAWTLENIVRYRGYMKG